MKYVGSRVLKVLRVRNVLAVQASNVRGFQECSMLQSLEPLEPENL